jgi:hypothetical protein
MRVIHMSLIEIVESGLKAAGFDGLVNPGTCGCLIGDLSPGTCISESCEGGYKHVHSKTGDWIVSIRKNGITDEEIDKCIDECG